MNFQNSYTSTTGTQLNAYDSFTCRLPFDGLTSSLESPPKKKNKRPRGESNCRDVKIEKREVSDYPDGPGPIDPDARSRRNNMAYPKGTFLIRLSDTCSTEANNAIWMVDNYQLLQKCVLDRTDSNGVRLYAKTERYSGWLADEPSLYFPLTNIQMIKDPTNPLNALIALISTPTAEELEHHSNMSNVKPQIS